jgi:hypothetical protein
MKKILTFILASFLGIAAFGQISTNGVYVSKGVTTEVGTDIYSINPTNQSVVVQFSNGLIGKVETNADFQINSFFQDVENTSKNPERAKFGQSTLAVTLTEGSAFFVYPETDTNSSCVVSTPFADVELHRGTFYFVVNTNNALCLVIDGSFIAHGEKKQEKKMEAGSALVVAPTLQGIFDTKFSFSSMPIYDATLSRYRSTIKELSATTNSVLFIRINGKTVAVTL